MCDHFCGPGKCFILLLQLGQKRQLLSLQPRQFHAGIPIKLRQVITDHIQALIISLRIPERLDHRAKLYRPQARRFNQNATIFRGESLQLIQKRLELKQVFDRSRLGEQSEDLFQPSARGIQPGPVLFIEGQTIRPIGDRILKGGSDHHRPVGIEGDGQHSDRFRHCRHRRRQAHARHVQNLTA